MGREWLEEELGCASKLHKRKMERLNKVLLERLSDFAAVVH